MSGCNDLGVGTISLEIICYGIVEGYPRRDVVCCRMSVLEVMGTYVVYHCTIVFGLVSL